MVVCEVQAHAFKGMGAARLGMLDLLSSFEEVLKGKMLRDMVNILERYPTMNRDVSSKIYHRLVATLKETIPESSLMSTMNCKSFIIIYLQRISSSTSRAHSAMICA